MRKFISLILALCLLVSIYIPASAAKVDSMTDVPSGQWFYEAVSYCLEHSYMDGVGGGKFDPKGTVNRAQIAQVLYNKAGKPSTEGLANPFTDVGEQWYKAAIVWCKANDVVSGTSSTTFAPTKPVSREQVCTMFYNYFKDYLAKAPELAEVSDMGKYTDWGKVSNWAQDAVRWAVKSGFMKGKSSTTLDPKGQATRAELAQFLVNFDKVLGTEDKPNPTPVPTVCIHGNQKDKCPICNAEKPSGLYNPNPSQSTIDSVMMSTEVTAEGNQDYEDRYFSDPDYFDGVDHETGEENIEVSRETRVYGYENCNLSSDVKSTMTSADSAIVSRTNIPDGGKVVNGKLYNKYGQDISSVDGAMNDFEFDIYRALIYPDYIMSMVNYGNAQYVGRAQFSSMMQATAEDRLVQVIENMENYAKSGMPISDDPQYSTSRWTKTFDVAVISQTPKATRQLLEIAKKTTDKKTIENEFRTWCNISGNTVSAWPSNDPIYYDLINQNDGARETIYDWKHGNPGNQQIYETIVHFDSSVRDSARGITAADVASYFYYLNGNVWESGGNNFEVGVAYDPVTSTAIILRGKNVY